MKQEASDQSERAPNLFDLARSPVPYRPTLVSVVAIAIGLALLAAGIYDEIFRFRFLLDSKHAQAEVETYSFERGQYRGGPAVTWSRLRYRTEDGRLLRVSLRIVGDSSGFHRVGQTVPIRYLASDPYEVRTEAELRDVWRNSVWFIAGIFFLFLGYVAGKRPADADP